MLKTKKPIKTELILLFNIYTDDLTTLTLRNGRTKKGGKIKD